MKLAEFTGTAWNVQTVVSNNGCAWGSAFAFDLGGAGYVAYSDAKKKLVVGQRTGAAWSFQAFSQLASYMSMAIAPDGHPSVAFENYGDGLMFGHRSPGGTWQFTTVDTTPTTGDAITFVNLAYDDSGAATIAYRNGPTVRYARLEQGASVWSIDVAHASPAANWYLSTVSLTFANSEPVIAFQQHNQSTGRYELLVTRKSSGGWVPASTVESFALSDVLISTSAAYDSVHGLVGITFGPGQVRHLRFAEGPADVVGQ